MGTFKTSHYDIFDYWKDKCISKDGRIYLEGKYDYSKSIPVIEDWGEPTCWGCGKVIKVEDEELYLDWLENDDFKKIWNSKTVKRKLQRCHIKARALNGDDNPNNLFLLCKDCHRESPDVYDKKMFLKWVYNKRKGGFDNPVVDAIDILRNDYSIRFPVFTDDAVILDETIGSHSGAISYNTYVYAYVSNALKNKTELEGENEKMYKQFLNEKINELERKIKLSDEEKAILNVYKECLNNYDMFKTLEAIED